MPKPTPNFMFEVPNDEQGRYFIELLRKFSRNGVRFRTYGRHSDRQRLKKEGKTIHPWGHNDVPSRHGERIVVYATTKDAYTFGPQDVEGYRKAREAKWDMEAKLRSAISALATAKRGIDEAQDDLCSEV